ERLADLLAQRGVGDRDDDFDRRGAAPKRALDRHVGFGMPIAAIGEDGRSGGAENAQDEGGTAEQTSHGWREEQIRRHRLGCIRGAYNSFTGKSLMTGVFPDVLQATLVPVQLWDITTGDKRHESSRSRAI